MHIPFPDATTRFSTKAEVYAKARPRYPKEIVYFLESQDVLHRGDTIVDLGSGTGLSAQPFLDAGYSVIGVEPNDPMRSEGDGFLSQYSGFRSVKGDSEVTTLPEESVNVVVAAQAFHWFHLEKTRTEMQRILKAPGWFVAIWNHRRHNASALHREYEAILRKYCPDYSRLAELYRNPERSTAFLGAGYGDATLQNPQSLDWELFEARVLSASYIPKPEHPDFAQFMGEMRELFEKHAHEGKVVFDLEIWIHYGQLKPSANSPG